QEFRRRRRRREGPESGPYCHSVQSGAPWRRGAALSHHPVADQPGRRKERDAVAPVLDAGAKVLLAACLAGAAMLVPAAPALAETVEIRLLQTADGKTYFDPAGV